MINLVVRMAVLTAAALLGGCQIQNATMVSQAPVAPARVIVRGVPSPCASPANTGPFELLGRTVSGTNAPFPAKATAEHVSGCAGVRFRIGPDGVPRDIAVLTEYPLDYGFGDTARLLVAGARWPAKDDMAWRYLIINMRPRPVPPA